MARNEEKHYGKLNRLYLLREKEEFEKANPKRPRLDSLHTVEEVQKWLPSIKKDLDFYLKKSQVTCYSDAHVEECKEKVIKLEKEFKAFVRKIKQLNPSLLDAIPWTSRPYHRKKPVDVNKDTSCKKFERIATPILDNDSPEIKAVPSLSVIESDIMNQPLKFSIPSSKDNQDLKQRELNSNLYKSNSNNINLNFDCFQTDQNVPKAICNEGRKNELLNKDPKNCLNIVNYNSSDCFQADQNVPKAICNEEQKNELLTKDPKNCLNIVNYDSSDCEDL